MSRLHIRSAVRTRRGGMRRRGFTLIEVITAITLTAIVLAIAAAALGAATTARERVGTHQRTLESEARVQALLTDMLRHAPAAEWVSEPLLRVDRAAAPHARLVFLSTGVREPFGTGTPWRVTATTDANGFTLDAEALDRYGVTDPTAAPLHARVPSLHLLDVRVRETDRPGETGDWRTDWPDALSRPAVVQLRFNELVDRAAQSGTQRGATRGGEAGAPTVLAVALDPLAVVR